MMPIISAEADRPGGSGWRIVDSPVLYGTVALVVLVTIPLCLALRAAVAVPATP